MSETLLEAGAILPGAPEGGAVDTMTARAYRHPALDGRTVVRLVGAAVGPAEDLTMEFLGFGPAAEPVAVGHARRQALGFPAWALVHDPANGRHALALVKEMEKLARVARGKPGNAKDGYDILAGRLGAAAPQFLPTFWEQAGRAFLAADNPRMAGTCFTAARRAEQVHGLAVDEDRVRDVHLEFAFAGALTAAMLTEYARGVVDRRPPAEAYELVKTLALRRVAGGLPPHASIAADLARLAKAAGLDPEAEADEIVPRLLTYPAMGRAHPSVWKSYRKCLVRLGKRDAAMRARLLEIVPDPPGYDSDMTDQWLELLEASGAAADLIGAGWTGSASRWLERTLAGRSSRRDRRHVRMLSLVERMVPRLVTEGGVQLSAYPGRVNLDVLDVCVAGGVRADIGADRRGGELDVTSWVSDAGPGRRDLAALAADPALRPMLRQGVRQAIRSLRDGESLTSPALPAQTLEQAFGATGVREVLVELILEQAGRAAGNTIAGLDADLTELAPLWSPAGMALAPDGFRRLLTVDLAEVVGRTLRAGLLAELSWPAYEAVATEKKGIQIGRSWPDLVVHDEQSAHVITPDGTVTEHVFRFPAAGQRHAPSRWQRTSVARADDDLLVSWNSEDGPAAYWASRPAELSDGEWHFQQSGWGVPVVPLPVPGGGLTTGTRPVRSGDTRGPAESYPLASDGQAYWRCEWVREETASGQWIWRWREFDPRTGNDGRVSMPAFFAAATGGTLVPQACQLRPVPPAFAGSPLGVHDGLAGWQVVTTADGSQIGVGADGRRVTLPARYQRQGMPTLVGAVTLPGSATPLPVVKTGGYRDDQIQVWSADGEHLLSRHGVFTTTLPPLPWWHALRPRDEAGSAVLRKIDEQAAAALLAVDDAITGTVPVKKAVTANVAAVLPEVTAEVLRDRIAEVVARAVRMRRRLAEIAKHLAATPEPISEPPALTDEALDRAWAGLCGNSHTYWGGSRPIGFQTIEQVSLVGAVLGAGAEARIPAVDADWTDLLPGLGAAALRAAAASTTEADRDTLAGFLAVVAETPLAGNGPPLRVLELNLPETSGDRVAVLREGAQTTVLFPPDRRYHYTSSGWTRTAVQVATDGAFTLPPGFTLAEEARPSGRMNGERLRRFGALLAERGPAPWRPAAADELAAATGMTRGEAVLLLAGLPGIRVWEANFLTTEQRTTLGLSAAQAKVARASLKQLSRTERVALLDAAMPTDPADLWAHGPDVAAIAAEWIRLRGRRIAVPEELVAELARVIDAAQAAGVLQAIAGPRAGDWLTTDGRSKVLGYHHLGIEADEGVPFDGTHLLAAATALPWLGYHLRWDDPLRATLPGALELVRARLRNPDLLVGSGMHEVSRRPDAGPALIDGHSLGEYRGHHLAPAKLGGADDPALGFVESETATALRTVLSDWIDDVVATPTGGAGDPRDPRVGVPHLVEEAAERLGCGADAATYYLQLLALPDPTDKTIQAWNGWKPAQLRTAREELVAAGLLVVAKRERAGRAVFLPGGWIPAKAPALPVESWKQPLYAEHGRYRVVTRSVPQLYATAWARIVAGDLPRYRDLEEKP